MRILLVSHKLAPHSLGGVEVYTLNLARALQAQHEVSVFYRHDKPGGPPYSEDDQDSDGIWTHCISCNPIGLSASVAGQFFDTFVNQQIEDSFVRFVDRFRPDLIHVQHVMGLSARLLLLARRHGSPVILTLHDYWFLCGNSQLIWPDARTCQGKAWGMNCVRCATAARFSSSLARWLRPVLAPLFLYRDHLVRQTALAADLFISPSQFLIGQYVAAGFPSDRFACLENGIPVQRILQFARQPPSGRLRVSFLGSLAWQKGIHILVEAFNGLPHDVACLRIWGDPTIFPDYAQRLRQTLTHPDAQLMGRLANEEVGRALADSDVMVVPSLWYENSPVVIQEARAAGVPIVASAHGALAEKIRHEVDGLLFPPGDVAALRQALQRLINDPDLRFRLRQNTQPPMDMDEHVRRLEVLYRQLVPLKHTR